MANRRELERRIRSNKNMAQITKAMQMVSASRMRRAQSRVTASRAYAEQLQGIVRDLDNRVGAETHPLLQERPIQNVEVITVTADRGLAGALVTNVNRETLRVVESAEHPVRIVAVGRKGRGFAVRLRWNLVSEFTGLSDNFSLADIRPIARQVLEDFENGATDAVHLVYTQFITTLRQQARTIQLLPVVPPEDTEITSPWNYEPDNPVEVLSELLPRYVEFSLYQAMLEAKASEHSARMIAMSNATDNAEDLVKELTLLSNKARQADITKEIAEISGAAEAILAG